MYVIYTDGSYVQVSKRGAWAYVILDEKAEKIIREDSKLVTDTTNNRMELMAIDEAMKHVPKGSQVTIHSDSTYCVNSFGQWVYGWSRNGWVKRDGSSVQHKDIMMRFLAYQKSHKVSIFHVKAHSGIKWNEYVDSAAGKLTQPETMKAASVTPKRSNMLIIGMTDNTPESDIKKLLKDRDVKSIILPNVDGKALIQKILAKDKVAIRIISPSSTSNRGKKRHSRKLAAMCHRVGMVTSKLDNHASDILSQCRIKKKEIIEL